MIKFDPTQAIWAQAEALAHQLLILEALLQATCAERSEGFFTMDEDARNWYLTNAAWIAGSCAKMADQISEQALNERKSGKGNS